MHITRVWMFKVKVLRKSKNNAALLSVYATLCCRLKSRKSVYYTLHIFCNSFGGEFISDVIKSWCFKPTSSNTSFNVVFAQPPAVMTSFMNAPLHICFLAETFQLNFEFRSLRERRKYLHIALTMTYFLILFFECDTKVFVHRSALEIVQ